jgi:tripartite-type tricarboxylate transporter receptor subunit TctC
MTAHRHWLGVGLLCILAMTSAKCLAQVETYPAGPVKFITQLGAGSGTDPAMRIVIEQLGKRWGQQTLLINQPGANGALAARAVHAASPDGRTLYMAIASTFTVLPNIQVNAFSVDDFLPIGFVGEVPMAVAVARGFPTTSLAELLAYAKRQRGGLNIALTRGGIPHMAAELLRKRSGAELTYVFYPGSAQAMSDVVGGRVPVMIDGLAGPLAGGQLNVLAVASTTRVATHPNLPAFAETLPGFTATGWFALVAPPGTPAAIVKKISEDLEAVLIQDDVKQKLGALSVSTRSMSPQALTEFIRSERELWQPIVRQIGLGTQ